MLKDKKKFNTSGDIFDSALIISQFPAQAFYIEKTLRDVGCREITFAAAGGLARRTAAVREFDLYIIDSPLADGSGEELALDLAQGNSGQLILAMPSDRLKFIDRRMAAAGVMTVPKPLDGEMLRNTLNAAAAAHKKAAAVPAPNALFVSRPEDLRLITAAKRILIAQGMTEPAAHQYIIRTAMDMRLKKTEVAHMIIESAVE